MTSTRHGHRHPPGMTPMMTQVQPQDHVSRWPMSPDVTCHQLLNSLKLFLPAALFSYLMNVKTRQSTCMTINQSVDSWHLQHCTTAGHTAAPSNIKYFHKQLSNIFLPLTSRTHKREREVIKYFFISKFLRCGKAMIGKLNFTLTKRDAIWSNLLIPNGWPEGNSE